VGVGGAALLETLSIAVPSALREEATTLEEAGRTVLYVTVGDTVDALLVLSEAVRPGAESATAALREEGLDLQVITGDQSAAAEHVGRRLDMPVLSAMGPVDKIEAIQRLRDRGATVAMVGDGINDAAALAEADVGIAMGSGARISLEAADVALYNPDLRGIAWLRQLAARTARIIRQNLAWTFGYNAIGLGLAVAGLLHPLAAVAVMTLSSAFVTWNALRIKQQPPLAGAGVALG
jgi:P-type E1-E2 ATPase